MTQGTIYNTSGGPLPYDRAGRVLGAGERLEVDDVTASPISGHVAAERFIVLDAVTDVEALEVDAVDDAPQAVDTTQTKAARGRRSTTTPEA